MTEIRTSFSASTPHYVYRLAYKGPEYQDRPKGAPEMDEIRALYGDALPEKFTLCLSGSIDDCPRWHWNTLREGLGVGNRGYMRKPSAELLRIMGRAMDGKPVPFGWDDGEVEFKDEQGYKLALFFREGHEPYRGDHFVCWIEDAE